MAKTAPNTQLNVQTFIEDTTLHGLKNACDMKFGLCRRITWSFILTSMCALLFTAAGLTLRDYLRHDSYLSTKEYTAEKLALPSVTICNLYPIKRSVLNELVRQLHILETFGPQVLQNMSDGTPLVIAPNSEFSRRSTLNTREFIPWCAWENTPFNCTERFSNITTDSRYCHIFMPQSVVNKQGRLHAKGTGENFGITLAIDIYEEENYFTSVANNFGSGVNIIIHDPGTWPMAAEESIYLAPGMVHHVGLEYEEHLRLTTPYAIEACISRQENATYNYEHCIADCSVKLMTRNCTCASHGHLSPCTFVDLNTCYNTNIASEFRRKCSHCKRNCEEKNYQISVTSTLFPTRNTYEEVKRHIGLNRTFPEAQESVMILKVFFRSLKYKVTEQHPSYEETALLANMGGLIGLAVGASLITLCEMAEMVAVHTATLVKKCKPVKRRILVQPAPHISPGVRSKADLSS